MQVKQQPKWMSICRFVLGAYTVLIGTLLANQAITIYLNGVSPANTLGVGVYVHPVYSTQIVAEYFATIAWIVYGWLIVTAGMLVCSLFLPKVDCRVAPEALATVARLEKRMATQSPQSEEAQRVLREQRRRKYITLSVIVLCAACLAVCLIYLLTPGRFQSTDLEPVMAQLAVHVFPWILVGFAVACVGALLMNQSAVREIPDVKKLIGKQPAAKEARNRNQTVLRIALYAVAVALIVWGVLNLGMRDVLMKAINICTECVGLG